MLNTPFHEKNEETVKDMTKLWSQIFAVAMQQNIGILKTTIFLNDHFEDLYNSYSERDVFMRCFEELGILYTEK